MFEDPLNIFKIVIKTQIMIYDGSGKMNVNEMAEKLNIEPSYLSKIYKNQTGRKISFERDIIRIIYLMENSKKGKKMKEIAKELDMSPRNIYALLKRNSFFPS